MSSLIYFAIPLFVVTMLVELAWSRRAQHRGAPIAGYDWRDSRTSLAMGIGNVLISLGTKLLAVMVLAWLYRHRLWTAPAGAIGWVLLFVAEDFCYYWFHRVSHESRFFWAAHVNHHSSEFYNLSTALRQSWTTPLIGMIFWWPLAILGFSPEMIITQQAISLLYQYWIHTESIRSIGPLEWVFNTPSHHRVHHGSNVEYLDRNHGGILIVWDRLFGTFEPEVEKVHYGLTKNLRTFSLPIVAFHEWAALFSDVARAKTLGEALGYAFAPPGWRPNGASETAHVLRARALSAHARRET